MSTVKIKKVNTDTSECALTMIYLLKYADDLLTLLPAKRRKYYSKLIKEVPDEKLFDVIKELEKETWNRRPEDLEITVDGFIETLREFNCIEFE